MNTTDIPTPLTNEAIEVGSDPWDLASSLERKTILLREALADMLMDHKPYGPTQLARFRKANTVMIATEPKS